MGSLTNKGVTEVYARGPCADAKQQIGLYLKKERPAKSVNR